MSCVVGLAGVRVKMSVKHNDESSEHVIRRAEITKESRQEEIGGEKGVRV